MVLISKRWLLLPARPRRHRSATSNRLRQPSPTHHLGLTTLASKMIPRQNLCGIPSLASTTAANHYFLYFTDCIHLFPSIPAFPRLPNPSANPLQSLIIFSKTPRQISPHRAFFNLPGRTITCPAACTSRNPSATIRVDLEEATNTVVACRTLRSPAQVTEISHPPSVRALLRVRKQLRGHSRITSLSRMLRI